MSFPANLFSQLLGLAPVRMPRSGSVTVVIDGRPITDLRQIDSDNDDARRAVRRAKWAAKYQRARQDPEKMAKRRAWAERNREKLRAYKREYDARTKAHQRKQKTAWQRAKYHADPQAGRQAGREYYQRNREKILARLKAKRDAARAAGGRQP